MSKILLLTAVLAVILLAVKAEKPTKESNAENKLVEVKLKKKELAPTSQKINDVLKDLGKEFDQVKSKAKHMKKDRKAMQLKRMMKNALLKKRKLYKMLRELKKDGKDLIKEKRTLKKLIEKNNKHFKKIYKLKQRNMNPHKRHKGHKNRNMKKKGMKKRGKQHKQHKRHEKHQKKDN